MSGREKVLIAASAAAVIWAVLMFTLPGKKMGARRSGADNDVTAFITRVTATADPGAGNALNTRIIEGARGPWGDSPFLDTGALSYGADTDLRYQGFVRTGGRVYALVNNREYGPGERIGETDMRVMTIGRDQLVLIVHGRKKRILPLEKGL